jgi:catalase
MKEAAAIQFVSDAFVHPKAIGATKAAKPLLDAANVRLDKGVTALDKSFINAAGQRFWAREATVRMLA